MQRVVVIGAGGLAKRVLDIVERTPDQMVVGLIAIDRAAGETFAGYPVLGGDADLPAVVARHAVDGALVAIGDNWRRAAVARAACAAVPGLRLATAVHPSVQIARGATIGAGAIVSAGAILDSDACVGLLTLVQLGATVGHDAVLDEHASLGSHAGAGGAARIGAYSAVGVGALLVHRVSVGAHTVIGAGATVTRDVPAYVVAYGTPARVVRTRQAGDPYL